MISLGDSWWRTCSYTSLAWTCCPTTGSPSTAETPACSTESNFYHARRHRATISRQCERNRRRHAPRQPPGGIPRVDQTNREPSRGAAQYHAPYPHNTRPPPVAYNPRRLAPDRLAMAKAEFDSVLHDGRARRAEGPWSSALHLVPKNDGG